MINESTQRRKINFWPIFTETRKKSSVIFEQWELEILIKRFRIQPLTWKQKVIMQSRALKVNNIMSRADDAASFLFLSSWSLFNQKSLDWFWA